jgi:hypothetical protein
MWLHPTGCRRFTPWGVTAPWQALRTQRIGSPLPARLSRISPAIKAGRNPAGKLPKFSSGRTKISITMKIFFHHYEKIFPSLWKFSRITMEIFVRPDGIFHSSVVLIFVRLA